MISNRFLCLTYLDDDDEEEDDDDDPKSVISTNIVAMDVKKKLTRKQNGKVTNYLQDAIS